MEFPRRPLPPRLPPCQKKTTKYIIFIDLPELKMASTCTAYNKRLQSALKHGASLYKEAELFSLPITNPKGRHKTKGLISKTMTLHVRYRFWYISLPSSAKQQREMNMYVLHCILIIYHLSFYISENVVL